MSDHWKIERHKKRQSKRLENQILEKSRHANRIGSTIFKLQSVYDSEWWENALIR